MSYPTPQDFQEAIQNPKHNLLDEELQRGQLVVNALGLPRVTSGSFASVYKFICDGKPVAVRCFLRNIESQEHRYERISQFIMSDDLPYTVSFQYLRNGIRIHGSLYPLLKMEWVEGECLDSFLRKNVRDSGKIVRLRIRFEEMVADLQRAGIAHGDLQHGNIMVIDGGNDLRLVDYDGMYVPSLQGTQATELGHRNYQHPARSMNHFSAHLDNFAAWSICTSLKLMELDPALTEKLSGLDECLLFKQTDYKNPERSRAFHVLEEHRNEEVIALAKAFRAINHLPIEQLPTIGSQLSVNVAELPQLVSASNSRAGSADGSDWWRESNVDGQSATRLSEITAQAGLAADSTSQQSSYGSAGRYTTPFSWPTLDEYCEAFTRPGRCFVHGASPKIQFRRKFEPIVGKHGAIFRVRMIGPDRDRMGWDLAMKVFLSGDRTDLETRYEYIQQFIEQMDVAWRKKHFLKIRLYRGGLNINGRLCPFVLMPWIEGPTLERFLLDSENEKSPTWKNFSAEVRSLSECLRQLRVVHGDIEPANLIFDSGHLKLLDYDTMAVPSHNVTSPQSSDISCRHPLDDGTAGASVSDNFALWLLDTNGLVSDWHQLKSTSHVVGTLFFQAAHFNSPYTRMLLQRYEHTPFGERIELMDRFCEISPFQVPPLTLDGSVSAAWMQLHGPKPVNPFAAKLQNSQLAAQLSVRKSSSTTPSQPLVGPAPSNTNTKLVSSLALGTALTLAIAMPSPFTIGCLPFVYAWLCPTRWLANEMRVVSALLFYSVPGATLIWLITNSVCWAISAFTTPSPIPFLTGALLFLVCLCVFSVLAPTLRKLSIGTWNLIHSRKWPIVGQANQMALAFGPLLAICWWAAWLLHVPIFAFFMSSVMSLVVIFVNAHEQKKHSSHP